MNDHAQANPAPSGEPSAEEKLELIEVMLDLIPDFFYVHDDQVRFQYANRAASEYFGVTKDDLVGRRLLDVDPDREQAQRFVDICTRILREGRPRSTDRLAYKRRDGSPGFLRQYDIPFKSPVDGSSLLMGLSRDVTAEVELEHQRVHAAKLEAELELAREIQAALRPARSVLVPGVAIAGFAEPAAYAGGDFFDWGRGIDGRFLAGVGDVTGHGVGPALLASSCRAFLRALATTLPTDDLISRLNELMCMDAVEGRFVTLAIAEIDPAARTLSLSSAGHGPMYVVPSSDRPCGEFAAQRPPLGLSSTLLDAQPLRIPLEPLDAVVLVSDGVYEAMNARGESFGLARLRDVLHTARGRTPDAIVQLVLDAVRTHLAGTPHQDDLTVVVATLTA